MSLPQGEVEGKNDAKEQQAAAPAVEEFLPKSLPDLLQLFLLLQMERAGIYKDFEEGFKQYLQGRDEVAYMRLCQSITAQFSACSSRVNGVEAALRGQEHNRADLADIIRAVQGDEKRKLETTVILQVLRKAGRPSERASEPSMVDAPHQCEGGGMAEGHSGGPCGHHVKSEEGASGVAEAEAESEYEAAYGGSVQILQDVIIGINERLDEIRQEMDELL